MVSPILDDFERASSKISCVSDHRRVTHTCFKHSCRSRSLPAVPSFASPVDADPPPRRSSRRKQKVSTRKRQRHRDPSYIYSSEFGTDEESKVAMPEEKEVVTELRRSSKRIRRLASISDDQDDCNDAPNSTAAPATDAVLPQGYVRVLLTLEDVQRLLASVNAVLDCFRS